MRFYVSEKLSENMAETPEGYLLCLNVPITRVGEFLYKGSELLGHDGKPLVESGNDGIVRIQRDEEAVFEENTLKSFEGKPFTIDHPKGFVGPENWPDLAHGTTQNVRRGEGNQKDLVLADILVTTEEAIELIKSGQREISCGYDAEYEQIEKGIGRQTSIIGNHVALVSKGRAGSRCAIADHACTGCGVCTCGKNKTEKQEESMKLKDKFMKWLDACPIKDEDEDLDEKKKKEEEEAAAAKDKKTKDEGDDRLAAVESRLDRIEELLEALVSDDESETKDADEDEDDEEKKKESEDADEDEDDEEKKKKESETADEDEEEEKKKEEEEKAEVNDAWPDFISKADIIDPGVKLRKPTKDHRKTFDSMKADVLERAANSGDYGREVKVLLSGRTRFGHMTSDALDVAFSAAAELIGRKRNEKIQQGKVSTKDHKFSEAKTISQINEANRVFYGEQTRK